MADGRLIQHHGEAIVLRTWPFHEADLLVSVFTREHGKVKGVARHAMRSRRRFGGALEPGTHVRAAWAERPRQDLVRLDSFEILWSPLTAEVDALRLAGLQLVVEVLDEAMPEGAPEDAVFRLALTVLAAMGVQGPGGRGGVWLPVTYFCLWMNRLMGWMPELGHCAVCGLDLRGGVVWWSPVGDGVTCGDDRRTGSVALSAASVAESYRMFRTPLAVLAEDDWPASRAADLRAFAVGTLERHLERRLRSAVALGR
jgi:DNA repair protein RecO (recombination protein O)